MIRLVEKWQLDEDKLTFIILAAAAKLDQEFPTNLALSPTDKSLANLQMIGDVNIFLNGALQPSPQAEQARLNNPFENILTIHFDASLGGTESNFFL